MEIQLNSEEGEFAYRDIAYNYSTSGIDLRVETNVTDRESRNRLTYIQKFIYDKYGITVQWGEGNQSINSPKIISYPYGKEIK